MITVTVNGTELEVPEGATILERGQAGRIVGADAVL